MRGGKREKEKNLSMNERKSQSTYSILFDMQINWKVEGGSMVMVEGFDHEVSERERLRLSGSMGLRELGKYKSQTQLFLGSK